jgi:hypothetical protein
MSRPVWFVQLLQRLFPRSADLARMTGLPLVGEIVDRLLFHGDRILYLPRDRTVPVSESVAQTADVVLPSQVVTHFIGRAEFHWIMDFCICRASLDCQDYPIDLGCLFLGEAVRGINPKLGRRVAKAEALAHVRRCREAGLVHLIGRNRLDTLWLGVGPGHKLLTICNCCPCCCLWRVLPHLAPQIGEKITRMPGLTVSVNGRCEGCGACTQGVCFVEAIRLVDGRAVIGEACRGCGRCAEICPQGAIELVIDGDRFVETAIARIAPLVDLS